MKMKMYKTLWRVKSEQDNTLLVFYHFGKRPYFSPYFLEEDKCYEIEAIWTLKLIFTFKIFFKCLFHNYVIR